MDGQIQARLWKDPDARDVAGDDHPSGAMTIGLRVRVGLRSAALAGMVMSIGVLTYDGGTTTHTTVSAMGV
jgi:hypothetical protein